MASEVAKLDANYKGVMTAVTNDSNLDIKMLRVDASTGRLLVDATVTLSEGATEADGTAGLPALIKIVGGYDGANVRVLKTNSSGQLDVRPLTSSDAVSAVQSGAWNITNISGTISLPTGAATSAKQDTGNTSVGNIDTNTTNIPNVIGTAAAAIPTKLLQIGGSDGTNARAIKTNSSGQLDIRALTASDVVAIGAGTAEIGNVKNSGTFAVQATQTTSPWVVQESTTLPSFTTAPDSVAVAASSSGDNTIISAPGANKIIYVYAYSISFNGTVNAKFTDGAAGTNKAGLFYGIANAGAANSVTPPYYLFKLTANTALVLNLSGAVAVGGHVSYFVI